MTVGFKIRDFIDLTNWRPVYPFDYTIEAHLLCPIDGTEFATIAAIVSLSCDERIRVGCCPTCGLVGYIDRPSTADVQRYYAETWMGETLEQSLQKASAFAQNTWTTTLRKGRALEIGCGYGGMVAKLIAEGYEVHATESCPVRAEAVRQVFGIPVTEEMPDRPFDLITSSHVLEHVADFMGLLHACRSRQELATVSGGFHRAGVLHASMPLFEREPSMGVLMFLPHLWSFGKESLCAALSASNYDAQASTNGMNLSVRAVPVLGCTDVPERDYVGAAIAKLLRGLGLVRETPAVLTWQRDFDGATWASANYAAWEQQHGFPRKVLVEKADAYRTAAPIELQYEGRVQLFHK